MRKQRMFTHDSQNCVSELFCGGNVVPLKRSGGRDDFRLATTRELEELLCLSPLGRSMPRSLVPHHLSRELWLPQIAVVRNRPPSAHRHHEVAVPRPSAHPADSRCGLRRRILEKS